MVQAIVELEMEMMRMKSDYPYFLFILFGVFYTIYLCVNCKD